MSGFNLIKTASSRSSCSFCVFPCTRMSSTMQITLSKHFGSFSILFWNLYGADFKPKESRWKQYLKTISAKIKGQLLVEDKGWQGTNFHFFFQRRNKRFSQHTLTIYLILPKKELVRWSTELQCAVHKLSSEHRVCFYFNNLPDRNHARVDDSLSLISNIWQFLGPFLLRGSCTITELCKAFSFSQQLRAEILSKSRQ